MGIELPPELAGVAAQAGVSWPEADEDRMREAAQAWRDAGTKVTNLTRDADETARTALGSVEGQSADAARRHWSTFVQPDTGHLTATARGCTDAADRLDHAANQVGTAKVEIVRNLVALAQTNDAAQQAAGAGHPQALLGLDTAVRGTAANVANITSNLVTAVQPASGVDMSGVQNLVNPTTPGGSPALDLVATATDAPAQVVSSVTDTVAGGPAQSGVVPGLVDTVAGGPAQSGMVPGVVDTVTGAPGYGNGPGPGVVPGLVDTVTGGPGHGGVVPGVVPGPGDVVGGAPVVGDGKLPGDPAYPGGGPGSVVGGGPGGPLPGGEPPLPPVGPDVLPGNPDTTGPVRILPIGAEPGLPDAPTPPTGVPIQGQTVQAGFAGAPVMDLPPQAPAQPAAGAIPGAPPPPAAGPVPGGGPIAAGPPAAGPAPGLAPAPAGPPGAGAGAAPAPASGQPGGDAARPPADRGRVPGAVTTAVPPGPQPPPAAPAPPPAAQPQRREYGDVPFWVHMFPIGHMPVVSEHPERQLPPPPCEVDYAPGMRFPPGDHPEHHLVESAQRLDELSVGVPALDPQAGLPADHPEVAVLAEGHDPLGGQHEREWDRRYLVRLGSVTAEGISSAGKEHAWPPGEQFPEGGTAPGEPEMLAEGTVLDRFGSPDGRVFAADATPFAKRSLPPDALAAGYHRYRVTRPIPVWRTISAPWFAQPGGADRYRTTYSALELVALGYLAEITGGAQ